MVMVEDGGDERYIQAEATATELALLKDIEKRDPLSEISEQEKELLWKHRHLCRGREYQGCSGSGWF